jgi:DNA-binding LytR/AlgR family response regulator
VRKKDDIFLIPVDEIVSIVADGELLHLQTRANEHFTITYRLKDLETRLDPAQFVRLSRGTIVSVTSIQRVTPVPGGTYVLVLNNGEQHQVSRLRARVLREQLLRL